VREKGRECKDKMICWSQTANNNTPEKRTWKWGRMYRTLYWWNMNLNKLKKLREQLDKHKYKCKEGCFSCCTRTPALEEELKMMEKELRRQGYTNPPNWKWDQYCEMLTPEGKCSVYSQRPIICRWFSDIGYKITKNWRSMVTQSCTYWTQEIRTATHEFVQYWDELMKKGVIIGAMDNFNLYENSK